MGSIDQKISGNGSRMIDLQELLLAALVIIPVSLSVIIPAISEGKPLEMKVIFGLCALVFGIIFAIHLTRREKE